MIDNTIPFYDLYGEAFIRQEPNVAHVEDIATRSRGLGWEIAPHRHNRLSQIIAVFNGQWTVDLDDKHHELLGDWLVLIPAGVVHGFHFASNTQGFVLSLNDSLLAGNGQSDTNISELSALDWRPQTLKFKNAEQISHFCNYIKLLKHELTADGVAQNLAVNHLVQMILVTVLRQQRLQDMTLSNASRESDILLKFRALIEQHYQHHLTVKGYAQHLHISVSKLNRLCRTLLHGSPKAIIHQRLLIEAKRSLVYTKQSVEEISAQLGFNDPAYFSRYFKKMEGVTARAFRQQGNIK
ncbi:helix-turn-helix domain-containing protein [Alteromonas sp. MMG017]|uniref:helix-turn-helix domain-containing protein n=1 Tax=Alteromonas sp. MMG017 TaxID=2822692 RepID=UPI001B3A5C47|nr:helix-turn-helix domain-containing protein [Alteromonas sp. MMG017]MBQ4828425.1 helix-turn-helix domain-containing protein [Alteromonas sp. MMG017]